MHAASQRPASSATTCGTISTTRSGDEITRQLRAVERLMTRLAHGSQVDRAGSMAVEQLGSGGKRLRARLALLSAHAWNVDPDQGLAWAAAVELLHNATLVHDDIQDGDRTRRGEPTLWAKHGVAQAINAGDLMLMLPFLAVSETSAPQAGPLCRLLAEYATRIVRGQVEELGLLSSGRLDLPSYVHAAAGKTGALLALPVMGAALLGGKAELEIRQLGDVFTRLGVLFQLQDDVVDLFGDKGRNAVGGDIYEGKVSALVVAHVERSPHTATELLQILAKPRHETTITDVERVRDLYLESAALEVVLSQIASLRMGVLADEALRREPELSAMTAELIALALRPIEHLLAQPAAPSQHLPSTQPNQGRPL